MQMQYCTSACEKVQNQEEWMQFASFKKRKRKENTFKKNVFFFLCIFFFLLWVRMVMRERWEQVGYKRKRFPFSSLDENITFFFVKQTCLAFGMRRIFTWLHTTFQLTLQCRQFWALICNFSWPFSSGMYLHFQSICIRGNSLREDRLKSES